MNDIKMNNKNEKNIKKNLQIAKATKLIINTKSYVNTSGRPACMLRNMQFTVCDDNMKS